MLDLLEALASGGLLFAGFVDNEGTFPGRWAALRERLGVMLFQWADGNLEQNLIPLFAIDRLPDLIADPLGEKTGMRLRSLADRLRIDDPSFDAIAAAAGDRLRALILEAATGVVPAELRDAHAADRNPFKGHAKLWFKSLDGGRELAEKVRATGVWEASIGARLGPFLAAVIDAQQDPGGTAVPAA